MKIEQLVPDFRPTSESGVYRKGGHCQSRIAMHIMHAEIMGTLPAPERKRKRKKK